MINVLYLYRGHDADLMGLLNEVGEKDFRNILKDALRVLTRPGYIPKVNLPSFKPYNGEKERISIPISIQSQKDEDIRELLSHIKYRQVNNFYRMALRFYIGAIPTLSSMLDIELIKTIPVYTPNGVIVFSNNIGVNPTKKSKDTIKKANKVIQKRIIEETIGNNNKEYSINSNNITKSDNNMDNISQVQNITVNDDDMDVLSLLEGLID